MNVDSDRIMESGRSAPRRSRTPRLVGVVHAYLKLPHAVPVIFVVLSTVMFSVIAAGGQPPSETLVLTVLAILGGQVAVGVVNELVDVETDARVKPWKPIPAGYVTTRGARILLAISLVVMVFFSSMLGWVALVLCAAGNAVGIGYSLWFKRTVVAWLPYLIALPLLPIWVFVAFDAFDARLLVLYPLGSFAGVGVHLAQSLPDVEADRASGMSNLTSMLGETRSFALAHASLGVSLTLAGVGTLLWIDVPRFMFGSAAFVVALTIGNVVLFRRNRLRGVMACFPCVAASTAILGVTWVVATTR